MITSDAGADLVITNARVLVVLTKDIFSIDPARIEKGRVRLTTMDGRVVYEAGVGGPAER
jgi:predicted amidohydrolase YtcJ